MDVTVPADETLVLSLDDPGDFEAAVVRLRPRTLAALRSVAALDIPASFGTEDDSEFEQVDDVRDLIPLSSLLEGQPLNDLAPGLFKAILSTVPDVTELPATVRLVQRVRLPSLSPAGNLSTRQLLLRQEPVRVRQVLVPEWLRALRVFVSLFKLGDVIVEPGATLVLAGSQLPARVNNFLVRPGGRVLQTAAYVKLDIRGRLEGDAA